MCEFESLCVCVFGVLYPSVVPRILILWASWWLWRPVHMPCVCSTAVLRFGYLAFPLSLYPPCQTPEHNYRIPKTTSDFQYNAKRFWSRCRCFSTLSLCLLFEFLFLSYLHHLLFSSPSDCWADSYFFLSKWLCSRLFSWYWVQLSTTINVVYLLLRHVFFNYGHSSN